VYSRQRLQMGSAAPRSRSTPSATTGCASSRTRGGAGSRCPPGGRGPTGRRSCCCRTPAATSGSIWRV